MEIFFDKRATRQIRLSAAGAVEDGDTETLREDVMDAFNEDQIEEIERRIDSGDFYDFLGEMLEEWSGEDVDELFELIENQLADVGIEIKYAAADVEEEDEPEADPVKAEESENDLEPEAEELDESDDEEDF